MTLVAAQVVQITGTTPTYVAASAGGDTVDTLAGGKVFVHVTNGGGVSTTLTVATPGNVSGLAIADLAVIVAAGAESVVGPLTSDLFGSLAALTWSATASVTFAVYRI